MAASDCNTRKFHNLYFSALSKLYYNTVLQHDTHVRDFEIQRDEEEDGDNGFRATTAKYPPPIMANFPKPKFKTELLPAYAFEETTAPIHTNKTYQRIIISSSSYYMRLFFFADLLVVFR
jgi:hypothetical protein